MDSKQLFKVAVVSYNWKFHNWFNDSCNLFQLLTHEPDAQWKTFHENAHNK